MQRKVDGNDLVEWGVRSGPFMKEALEIAASMELKKLPRHVIKDSILKKQKDLITLNETPAPFGDYLPVTSDIEAENKKGVVDAMNQIMKVPGIIGGAILPDACPAGTIPVGGVVAARNQIHPSYHSADVCCSMALTELLDADPKEVLDMIEKSVHFGHKTQEDHKRGVFLEGDFIKNFDENMFLRQLGKKATMDFGSQGDGNHFYYVGVSELTGNTCIVSHHGSRGFGAQVFNNGKRYAEAQLKQNARGIDKGHAWIQADTDEGKQYWEALKVVKEWTRRNHFDLHTYIADELEYKIIDQFWNPHNFVFQKEGESDVYYHAKGATPSYTYGEYSLIPMNMAEPILVTVPRIDFKSPKRNALGFAPHGAGRNQSRTKFLKSDEGLAIRTPVGIDARTFVKETDASEWPEAYKDAATVIKGIEDNHLARIVDRIMPYGNIMAGDVDYHSKWRVKRRKKEQDGS